MRIFWVGLATRYLAWALRVSRNSGLMSLLSKSKYTTRWARGLLGSSRGLTCCAALELTAAGAAAVTGAGAAAGAVLGFAAVVQPVASSASASTINPLRRVFMSSLLFARQVG